MRRLLCLVIILQLVSLIVHADWSTAKPQSATLKSFDQHCATFEDNKGRKFHIKRESLNRLKLVPKETKIEFFAEGLKSHKC